MFAGLDTGVASNKDGKVIGNLYSSSFCTEGCENPPKSCGVNKGCVGTNKFEQYCRNNMIQKHPFGRNH